MEFSHELKKEGRKILTYITHILKILVLLLKIFYGQHVIQAAYKMIKNWEKENPKDSKGQLSNSHRLEFLFLLHMHSFLFQTFWNLHLTRWN